MKFVLELDAELGAIVCIGADPGDAVGVATDRGADVAAVAADVDSDPAVVGAGVVVFGLADVMEDIIVDVETLVEEVDPVGRIQNCRLQNPNLTSASTSPKASTALIANGASQSGSQVMVQSSVVPE